MNSYIYKFQMKIRKNKIKENKKKERLNHHHRQYTYANNMS
jgi:hypothetical protein